MRNRHVLAVLASLLAALSAWAQSPAPIVNFRSMLQSESPAESPDGLGLGGNSLPPDTTGAVGQNHIMTAANFTVRITDKAGGNARTFGLRTWWNALRGPSTAPSLAPFDPVVTYDPFEQRWIFGCSVFKGGNPVDCAPATNPSRFVLAVSRTSDPLGEWYYYEFRATEAGWRFPAGAWFDQPTVGFNRHYIGIAVTVPCLPNDAVMILDKAQAYAGRSRYWLLSGEAARPGTADVSYQWFGANCVCRTYDNTENKLYILRHHDATVARYALSSIQPGARAGTLAVSANYVYADAAGWGHSMSGITTGNLIPQSGSMFGIDPMGERIRTALYRNGSVWAAHTAYLGNVTRGTARTEAQWFELRPTGTFQQIGRIGGLLFGWVASPSIAVNAAGDALVGYSRSTALSFLSAAYAFRAATDTPGTMRLGTTYQAGLGTILHWDGSAGMSRNRSGDYSTACPDPDNTTLWTAQEFAGTMNRWGIQWAAVQRPGAGAPVVSGSTTIRGTVGVPLEYFISTSPLATAFRTLTPLPAGLSLDGASGRISGTPTGHGRSSSEIIISNPSGGNTVAFFFDISASDLADAIDIDRTVHRAEVNSWFRQTTNTHDGIDAARSGVIPDSGSTWMEILVLPPATVSFWWKVSSERDHDFLSVYTNNVLHSSISGDAPWEQVTLDIPGRTFTTVRWEYRKDASIRSRQDAAYVDGVVIDDAVPTRLYIPEDLGVIAHDPFFIIPLPDPPPDARTRFEFHGVMPEGMSFDAKTGQLSGTVQTAGKYQFEIVAISPWGSQPTPVTLTVSGIPHRTALNDASGIYTSGGAMAWTTSDDTSLAHDMISAARSAALAPGQESWIERQVKGPALLSFWWALSGSMSDTYTVQLDGNEKGVLHGIVPYSRRVIDVPAGDHIVRWTFKKADAVNLAFPPEENPAADLGRRIAWLDEVVVGPSQPPVLPSLTTFRFAAGIPVLRQIEASNDPSSYSLSGTLPSGLQFDTVTGQISGTPDKAASVQMSVSASNSGGAGFGGLVIIVDDRNLGVGLGNPDSVPDSGGNVPWELDPLTEFNGGPTARSGKIGHSGSSWMQVALEGPAEFSFHWKVSSETNSDVLRLLIDGQENDRISGEVDWREKLVQVSAGSHAIRWEYSKNQSLNTGSDAGWVARFASYSLTPPGFVGPRAWPARKGQLFSSKVEAIGATQLTLTSPLPNGLTFDSQTGLISGSPQSSGTFEFTIQASNVAGSASQSFHLVVDGPPIKDGVEFDGPWETDPARPWFVQSQNSHDGTDAAQSAAVGDGESSWLRCKFDGPGTVSFWLAVSTERKHDSIQVLLDNVVQQSLAGERGWRQFSVFISQGPHQIEWRYEKDAIDSGGCDSIWIDQVAFAPADPLPTISVSSPAVAVAGSPFTLSPTANVSVNSWGAVGLPLGVGIDPSSGQIAGRPEVSGDYDVSLTASNASGVAAKPVLIRVISAFQRWAATYGLNGANAQPSADPDKDEISNISEYVLGMDPANPGSARFELGSDAVAELFRLSFLRDASATGVTLEVETSTDLKSWEAIAKAGGNAPMQSLVESISVTDEAEQGTLRRVTVKIPHSDRSMLFARIIVRY